MKKEKVEKQRKKLTVGQAYAVIVPCVLLSGYIVACILGLLSNLYYFINCRKWYADIPGGTAYYEECKSKYEVDYNVYSDAEIEQNSTLSSVKLHYFPSSNKVTDRYIIICPGGAYSKICIDYEGYPLAKRANELGVTAFVLEYRVGDDAEADAPFAPIRDLANAIKFIKANSATFGVSDEYSLCGFSAGANLVGLFGTDELGYSNYGIQKPSNIIMGYPWCYTDKNTSNWNMLMALVYGVAGNGSKAVLGDDLDAEAMLIKGKLSQNYPATYLVQGTLDMLVPPKSTVEFYNDLQSLNVQSTLTMGDGLSHGFGIAKGSVIEGWFDDALFFGI